MLARTPVTTIKALILPGYGNSGPDHWQSTWEAAHPGFVRVQQRSWEEPALREWVSAIERAVAEAGPHVVLVAHSLACLAVAEWSATSRLLAKGALLVAPPDPSREEFPASITGFDSISDRPLRFPSTLLASSDDPYGSIAYQRARAACWGSRFIEIGAHGHINSESGLGDWGEGYGHLRELLDRDS